MKLKFLANNFEWNAKRQLSQVEREFQKSKIDLKITLEKTSIQNIKWDTTYGAPIYIDYEWYYQNIIPLAKGFNIVCLAFTPTEWKPRDTAGWHKSPHDKVSGLEIEVYDENKKAKSGKPWLVHILSHEISHALFKMERIQTQQFDKIDQTHNYLYSANKKWELKKCLSFLNLKAIKQYLR